MRRSVLGLLITIAAPLAVEAQTPGSADPVAVVREYIAAQNRHDIDRMLSLFGEQVEIRVGLTNAVLANSLMSENQTQLRTRFTRITEGFPNTRTQVLEVISEGAVVMTKELTTNLPGDRSETGLAMYRVRNGKIESMWVVSSSTASGDN